jgi:pimeloyl-ACP methyl ester carboxylesterase
MMAAMRETLVLLHGFAGTGRAWEPLVASLDAERYTALAPDLRGHGAAATLRPVSFEAVVGDVLALAPERFALCGYSMGGRIALQVALAAPERVKRLVLVSTTAGIEDEEARARRRAADERLAGELERDGLGTFSERWLTGPLFAADPPAAHETTPAGSRPRCAASAPGRWSHSGTASASSRCLPASSSASTTRSSARSDSASHPRCPVRSPPSSPAPATPSHASPPERSPPPSAPDHDRCL